MDSSKIGSSDGRDRESFDKHLKRASETVKSWPEWKQSVLGKSSFSNAADCTVKKEK